MPADRSPSAQAAVRPMRVCYLMCYRDPDYVRGAAQIAALRADPGVALTVVRNASRGWRRYLEVLRGLLQARRSGPDVYVLGFRGHEIFAAVRWLTRGRPLAFDALMSPYAALAQERKAGLPGRLLAPLVRVLEGHALRHADLVLTDTPAHAAFYADRFGIAPERMLCLPVGAIETLPAATPLPQTTESGDEAFSLLFYGSFLPLHGVDVIVRAAAALRDLPLRFDFVGGSDAAQRRLRSLCARLGVTRYTHRAWVPLPTLLQEDIPRAALVLGGPFGGTPQARRVVTGKTAQALALGRPVAVGAIDGDTGFQDRVNCLLVPQDDPAALAAALRWAWEHRAALPGIGAAGRELYEHGYSTRVIRRRLVDGLAALAGRIASRDPQPR